MSTKEGAPTCSTPREDFQGQGALKCTPHQIYRFYYFWMQFSLKCLCGSNNYNLTRASRPIALQKSCRSHYVVSNANEAKQMLFVLIKKYCFKLWRQKYFIFLIWFYYLRSSHSTCFHLNLLTFNF